MISTICRKARLLANPILSANASPLSVVRASYCSTPGSSPRYDEAEQRAFLSSLPGGKVDLVKDHNTGIATVTLDNPQIHNAFNGGMMVELRDVVDELASWEQGKGILLHGADGTFCSGGDLNFMTEVFSPEAGANMSQYMQTTLNRLYQLPLVSVAVLEGATLGGGSEVALSCDFRVAASSAKLGFVQVRMGVGPGWGGGVKLVHAVGRSKALDIITTGKVFKASEALDVGLIEHILPDNEDVVEAARTWLKKRVFQDVAVIRALKQVVVNGTNKIDDDIMDNERRYFAGIWSGPAHARAMNSRTKHS